MFQAGANAGRASLLCSFSGDTEVLLADGTTKPISDIEVGDVVYAADPETGESGPRRVTHLWVHQDQLVDLTVEGGTITTTEDHPFWNETDQEWQRADQLDPGDHLLADIGLTVTVIGIDWTTTQTGTAHTSPSMASTPTTSPPMARTSSSTTQDQHAAPQVGHPAIASSEATQTAITSSKTRQSAMFLATAVQARRQYESTAPRRLPARRTTMQHRCRGMLRPGEHMARSVTSPPVRWRLRDVHRV